MGATAHTHWLSQLLRLMPARLHAWLDRWSYRLALKRAQARRLAARRHAPAEARAGASD